MIIIGIDPDSKDHGMAIYNNGVLTDLYLTNLMQFISYIKVSFDVISAVHIEDVCAMNAVFRQRQDRGNAAIHMKMANSVGKCQQAQIELERVCEWYKVRVVKHKISKNWKDKIGKKQFESVTGWNKRSNEDTRSAAYFGFLGHKNGIKKIK